MIVVAELDWVNYISIDGAQPVPLASLSAEQRETVTKIMSERIGRTLSAYFSSRPEELQYVFRGTEAEVNKA